jgi:hypothetical protein
MPVWLWTTMMEDSLCFFTGGWFKCAVALLVESKVEFINLMEV